MLKKFIQTCLVLIPIISLAQQKVTHRIEKTKGQDVVCPGRFVDEPSFNDMPIEVKLALQNRKARPAGTQKATFIVNYVSVPDKAREAFQRAVDIWSELLSSPVPIRVSVYWQDLGANVLGAANSADFYRNFPGAVEPNTYYPLALAEKLSGKELNSINEDDIFCRFNSKIQWYYGTSESVPTGNFDFTSIVLHELGHGLGFVSSLRVNGNQGSFGFGTRFNAIYDKFLQTDDRRGLVDTLKFKNPSIQLKNAITSTNDLFWVGPNTNFDGNEKVLIFSPNPYQPGSSVSHLDDAKYGGGQLNSLMTPTASLREKNLNPGPLVMKMMADMGWKSTSITHEPLKDLSTVGKVRFAANIFSDTSIVANSPLLYYVLNNGPTAQAKTIPLQKTAGSNEYFAELVLPANTTLVEYYFEVKDGFGLKNTAPGRAGFDGANFVYAFEVGKKDIYGPVLEHFPPSILNSTSPVSIQANIQDDYELGIKDAILTYSVNGAAMAPVTMKKYNPSTDNKAFSQGRADKDAYFAEDAIKNLKIGDQVKYQITSSDLSGNKTILPTYYAGTDQKDIPVPTQYEFTVTSIKGAPIKEYSTDFESNPDDFSLLGFKITQPDGFTNKGLHTSHPYTNGYGLLDPVPTVSGTNFPFVNFDKSEIAFLRTPIRIAGDAPQIVFDEVVLVEPGEASSRYGTSSFYDYVVVEGSFDGIDWFPIENGYDSRDTPSWNDLFLKTLGTTSAANSSGKGTQSITKKRTISLYGLNLDPADEGADILVRFRMYADQFTNGWGWSIDNLAIQKNVPIITGNEPVKSKNLNVFPNPGANSVRLEMPINEPQTVNIEVFSILSGKVYEEKINVTDKNLVHDISIGSYATGVYMIRVSGKDGHIVKRFVKQ
jgi:Secretion system C-terminal sorting domain